MDPCKSYHQERNHEEKRGRERARKRESECRACSHHQVHRSSLCTVLIVNTRACSICCNSQKEKKKYFFVAFRRSFFPRHPLLFFLQDDFSGTQISLTLQTFSIGIDAEERIRGYEPIRKRSTQRDRYVGGKSVTGSYLSRDLSRNSSA